MIIFALIDIFMIVFMWVWGQTAPTALKVVFTVLLSLRAIGEMIRFVND